MTLDQLRVFVAVAEREHMTAASRALNLSQSAVSNAILALETRYDLRLFDRVGRGVVLNDTGRLFLAEARAVLARARAAEAALADLGTLDRGRLAIFASQTIASYWLPSRLIDFRDAHPSIDLAVSAGNTREVARAVRDGEAELGFVEGEVEDAALRQEIVDVDQMIVVAAPSHPWADGRRLDTAAIAAGPWLLREAGSGTRSTLEAALAAMHVAPSALSVAMTLPTNEAVLAAVQGGAGVAALSEMVAADARRAGRLVRAPMDLPPRAFRLLRHAERYRSRAAEAFVARVRRAAEEGAAALVRG